MTSPVPQPVMRRTGAGVRETAQTPIRCLVVDDHPAILAGLRGLLASEPDVEVIDAVDSAEAALEHRQHWGSERHSLAVHRPTR